METGFICIPTHLSKMSEDGVLIRDGCLFDIMARGGEGHLFGGGRLFEEVRFVIECICR